jgi:hypothetical protein
LRIISLSVTERVQGLYGFELEPEVRDWLDNLSDSDYRRVDEVCGLLAEKGTRLGGPWSDHPRARTCEQDHQGPATETYERQV